jgi:hypothetical protein
MILYFPLHKIILGIEYSTDLLSMKKICIPRISKRLIIKAGKYSINSTQKRAPPGDKEYQERSKSQIFFPV